MAITGIGNNYNNIYESTYAAQKNEAAKETPTDSVSDYYSYLQKNHDCVKNGNVAISGSYLRQCANNSEKAKELEKTLSLYNEIRDRGYANAKQNAQRLGARLVSYSESWSIDDTGNVTMTASATVTSDTKGWKELKEEQEERLKEKEEKEEQEEKIKKQKEEKQEQLDKFKGVVVIAKNEENAASKEAGVIGANMDLKA